MSDLKLPGEDKRDKNQPSFARVSIWIFGIGVGLYLVLSGVIGALSKG